MDKNTKKHQNQFEIQDNSQNKQQNISIDHILNKMHKKHIPYVIKAQNILNKKSFTISKFFGDGENCFLFQVKNIYLNLFCTVKINFNSDNDYFEGDDYLINETQLLQEFDHPNIIKLKDYFLEDGMFFIFLEHCTDNIQEYKERIRDEDPELITIWSQLVDGLLEIHKKGIVLRDMKCDNILINSQGTIKFADFGFAFYESNVPQSFMGNIAHAAPELMNQMGQGVGDQKVIQNKACDIYSLGAMMFFLQGGSMFELMMQKFNFLDNLQVSKMQKQLFSKVMERDEKKRLRIEEVKKELKNLKILVDQNS